MNVHLQLKSTVDSYMYLQYITSVSSKRVSNYNSSTGRTIHNPIYSYTYTSVYNHSVTDVTTLIMFPFCTNSSTPYSHVRTYVHVRTCVGDPQERSVKITRTPLPKFGHILVTALHRLTVQRLK